MAPKTVTEKDMFLQNFERECQTTLKVLNALPEGKSEFKPHELSRTARQLAWETFVREQGLAAMALAGKIDFSQAPPPAPATFAEVIKAFEKASRETTDAVTRAGDDVLHRLVLFPVGPGKMGDLRAQDVLWAALSDQIHHRGQFSIYLRMAGGKVPSIYGPTADEPWM